MVIQKPEWYEKAEPALHGIMDGFASRVRAKLETPPESIIQRVNPFLLRARNAENPDDLAARILDTFTFHSEATMFGNVMEGLVITVCEHAYNGYKSMTPGVDLEYTDPKGIRVAVQIKSGENWGNSSEREKLREKFQTVRRILNQQYVQVRCIEGCCYGRSRRKDMGDFEQIVGAEFWQEITGWEGTAEAVFALIAEHAEDGMHAERSAAHSRVLACLEENAIVESGVIHWEQLLKFVLQR